MISKSALVYIKIPKTVSEKQLKQYNFVQIYKKKQNCRVNFVNRQKIGVTFCVKDDKKRRDSHPKKQVFNRS